MIGLDKNINGIRDDVDALIAQKFSKTPQIKRAAEQKARAIQLFLEVATPDQGYRYENLRVPLKSHRSLSL